MVNTKSIRIQMIACKRQGNTGLYDLLRDALATIVSLDVQNEKLSAKVEELKAPRIRVKKKQTNVTGRTLYLH